MSKMLYTAALLGALAIVGCTPPEQEEEVINPIHKDYEIYMDNTSN